MSSVHSSHGAITVWTPSWFFIIPYFYTNVKGKICKLNDAIFLSVSYCLYFFCLIFKSYSCYDISRFWGYKKDQATGSPLLGLLICSKITQQKGENAIKREKIAVCKEVYRPLYLAPLVRLELTTPRLTAACSTD